ncbi:uncharacterized protein SAPINGB_P002739 [Magnusiomyces paraingens]|uniref:Activator of Hsp90 ATPase AHSA1-like N-terminal domain-containing protein n=1 Tax=Magnusiomyces paraingens TaxID=2606893 RepID=A0A5E8BFS4_9ASCO|nr:uncharacterized protein SAPINGB_P002739 [Saprochaete ingens]VVT50390.1 unnamed protein product [Saprochaete ingens]
MVLHNPNNWHWVDKNCIDWAKKYFDETLPAISVEAPGPLTINVTRVKTLDGDVGVYQRKGKVISLFDLNMVLSYEATAPKKEDASSPEENLPVTGDITIPEIAYDSSADDYTFEIGTNAGPSNDTRDEAKKQVRAKLVPLLREALFAFGPELLRVHGQDIQHPTDQVKSTFTKSNQEESLAEIKGSNESTETSKASEPTASTGPAKTTAASEPATTKTESKGIRTTEYNTETAKTEVILHAPAAEVFATFIDKARVSAWSRSNPVYTPPSGVSASDTPTVGTRFSLFGGNVTGEFLELDPGQIIKQTWRLSEWKGRHHATLTLALIEGEADTTVKVLFEGVPVGEADEVLDNFEKYYVRPIKITFGYGAVL